MTIFEKIDNLESKKKMIFGLALIVPLIVEIAYLVFIKNMLVHMFIMAFSILLAYIGSGLLRNRTTREIEKRVSKKFK